MSLVESFFYAVYCKTRKIIPEIQRKIPFNTQ